MNILIDGQTLETPELNRGIGIYFKNVLNNMVKQRFEHVWFISVSDSALLRELDPWVSRNIVPIVDPVFAPSTEYQKSELYTSKINEIIDTNNIDAFWIPNPLMINVIFPSNRIKCRVFATIFDLIPAVMPVKDWPLNVKKEYHRRLVYLKDYKVIPFFISEATKVDYEKYIGENIGGGVTFLAADHRVFYNPRQNSNKDNIIVFTGGFDYRKNILGAIEAFIALLKKHADDQFIQSVKLYIVCKYNEADKEKLVSKLRKENVEEKVIFTGYISNEELANLYSKAMVFFFPSLYEGFGLPILEAMLGGAFVLSADNSSLPEVCGNYAMLCNALDFDNMADKLYEALYASLHESAEEREQRKNYALSYSWEKTAADTLHIVEAKEKRELKNRKHIAIVTPWPEQETGIANYIYKIVPYLSKWFEIDIFVDDLRNEKWKWKNFEYGNLYKIDLLDEMYSKYDKIIYQIGNNSQFHTQTLEKLLKYPGIVEIHDYVLHPFIYYSYFLKKKYDMYKFFLEIGYGKDGLKHYESVKNGWTVPDNEHFPMSHAISKLAVGTIVHNKWSSAHMKGMENVFVIPHPSFEQENIGISNKEEIKESITNKFYIDSGEIIIGCFGFVNSNKRPEKVIEAVEQLIQENYHVKLIFWGKANDNSIYELIKNKNLEDKIFIAGYLEKTVYEVALEMTDIVVNLRYPSMGETSGTLCEAFKFAKPVIVSEVNQYTEYPDEICWKVPVTEKEVLLLKEMLKYLIDHEDVRKVLGENGAAYANLVLKPDRIAELYKDVFYREDL